MSRPDELIRRLVALEKRLDNLVMPEVGLRCSDANVSNPPTDAELDAAFPNRYNGFSAVVDDNGDGLLTWFVVYTSVGWWYEGLSLAL